RTSCRPATSEVGHRGHATARIKDNNVFGLSVVLSHAAPSSFSLSPPLQSLTTVTLAGQLCTRPLLVEPRSALHPPRWQSATGTDRAKKAHECRTFRECRVPVSRR